MTTIASTAEECLCGGRPWEQGLLVDIGSTFTKVVVLEPTGAVRATARARTTIEDDVLLGVREALANLPADISQHFDWAQLCSSAAGGLRIASVGLTKALSGQAGTLAALGAGGKVIASETGYLDDEAVARIQASEPHLVLLSGGINGGNESALLHNARMLSEIGRQVGVIIAGNDHVADRAAAVMRGRINDVRTVSNVFPSPGEVAIAPAREVVRDLFMEHITAAKGLSGLMRELKSGCEPTPLAVSRAIWDMPRHSDESIVLIDLGGATTDVHSVGGRQYRLRNVDLPAPEVQRSVEGDLGMRWGAPGVVQAVPEAVVARCNELLGTDLERAAEARRADPAFIPHTADEQAIDREIATLAITTAVERHAGKIVVRSNPWGERHRVEGKDMRSCKNVLATGGALSFVEGAQELVADALSRCDRDAMVPVDPTIHIDNQYMLFAVGLVARLDSDLAQRSFRWITHNSRENSERSHP